MDSSVSLIVSLIKSDIKWQRLLKGLRNAGVLDDDFCIDVETVIMALMEIPEAQKENLFIAYEQAVDRAAEASYDKFIRNLDDLAKDVYDNLLASKESL